MRLAALGSCIILGTSVSSSAWALDDDARAPPQQNLWAGASNRHVWYGTQTLALDGLANVMIAVGAATSSMSNAAVPGAMLGLGIPTYVLGAPIVHWAHGNVGKGFGSLGMRLLSSIVGAGVGAAGATALKGAGLVAVGVLVVGIVEVPVIVDATMLAYDDVPSKQGWIAPTIAPTKSGATVGLVGSF